MSGFQKRRAERNEFRVGKTGGEIQSKSVFGPSSAHVWSPTGETRTERVKKAGADQLYNADPAT
jgi:hypothetical protein